MEIRHTLLAIALSATALAAQAQHSFGQSRQPPTRQAQGYTESNNNNPGSAGGQGHSGRPHHGPPPQAIAACNSLTAGASCTFMGHDHEKTGICWAPPDRPLACKPTDRPSGEHSKGGAGGPSTTPSASGQSRLSR